MNKTTDENKKSNKKKIIGIVTTIVIIIIILLLLLTKCTGDAPINTPNGDPTIDIGVDSNAGDIEEINRQKIQDELDAIARDAAINISMNSVVTFADGTSKGTANIKNNEVNNRPQFVEIIVKDTEEEIYKSGLIEVGKEIKEITLSKDLEPGEYACTAYFNAYNTETKTVAGKAGADITVVVEG